MDWILRYIKHLFLSAHVEMGNCTADVIFVIDSSASITFMYWYVAKQFVLDIVQGLKVNITTETSQMLQPYDITYNILDGYPASLGFPIVHHVHAIIVCT